MTRLYLGFLALLLANPALAGSDLPADATYRIVHADHGEIGRHRVTFARDGADLIVEVAVEAEVTIAFIPFYAFSSSRREVWRDGRLLSYRAETDDDGTAYRVEASAEGDQLKVETLEGSGAAPGAVMLTHPWNLKMTEQNQLMESKTGALLNVTIAPAGEETIEVAGQPVTARKFVVTGDQERELWYGSDGTWLQLRLESRGAQVTMTRQ